MQWCSTHHTGTSSALAAFSASQHPWERGESWAFFCIHGAPHQKKSNSKGSISFHLQQTGLSRTAHAGRPRRPQGWKSLGERGVSTCESTNLSPLLSCFLVCTLYPSEVQDIFLACLLELVLTFSKWLFGCFTILYPQCSKDKLKSQQLQMLPFREHALL